MAWRIGKQFGAENPVIAAHRGFSACYPENTLVAFEQAARLGVDMVELDISMTKDGVPMLYHDDNLENKSSPLTGGVKDYTLDELRQVRIGERLGMSDQPLATLEEFCQLYANYPNIAVNVDLKPWSGLDTTFVPVIKVLEKYGFLDRILFNSVDGEITRYIHDNTDYLTVGPPENWPGAVNQHPGVDGTYSTLSAICVPTDALTLEGTNYLRSIGKIVVSAPVADEEGAKRAMDCSVEIALCNDPRIMMRLVGR